MSLNIKERTELADSVLFWSCELYKEMFPARLEGFFNLHLACKMGDVQLASG